MFEQRECGGAGVDERIGKSEKVMPRLSFRLVSIG